MKIGLVGWGVETQSAYRYFGPDHFYVICNEHTADDMPTGDTITLKITEQIRISGDAGYGDDLTYLKGLDDCDSIIYSPTAWNNLLKVYSDSPITLAKMKTVQHIFFENVDKHKIIGVTGTKGKSTTVSLVYELLKTAGKNVFLGGNIGASPLDFIAEMASEDAVAVLELSSYQLRNLRCSPHVAVLLGITPEHLDWHGTFDAYAEAKATITKYQTREDVLIYDQRNDAAHSIAKKSLAQKIPIPNTNTILRVSGNHEVTLKDGTTIRPKMLGTHNLYNLQIATIAYSLYCGETEPIKKVATNYVGLEHRLEFVREVDGVKYYNDSVACTPEAAIAGVDSFDAPVIALIGGHDRGLDLNNFIQQLVERSGKIHQIICFGESGPLINKLLDKTSLPHTFTEKDMAEIVVLAHSQAREGDIVLLSPGFSSYDSYLKFSFRGDDFRKSVVALSGR